MSIETIIVQVEQPTVVVRTGVPGPEGPPGTAEGDVAGPAASIDGELPVFDGGTGKRLKRGTYTLATLLATARDRATHTGTQLAATISDFAAGVGALLSWSAISGKPTTFDPTAHKSSHATGGSDALTAADIGAASATHKSSHATGGSDALTAADIGAAAASHTHALSALTQSGAITGQAVVWNGTAWAPATISAGLPVAYTAASGVVPIDITAHSSGTTGFRLARGSNLRMELGVTADIPQLRLQDAYSSSGGLLIQTVYGSPAFFVNGTRVLDLSTAAAMFGGVSAITVGNAFGAGATYEVCAPTGDYGYASLNLRVRGGAGQASATSAARHGGSLALEGGAAGTFAGQAGNGGDVTIRGGAPTGGGTRGRVFVLDLPHV